MTAAPEGPQGQVRHFRSQFWVDLIALVMMLAVFAAGCWWAYLIIQEGTDSEGHMLIGAGLAFLAWGLLDSISRTLGSAHGWAKALAQLKGHP